MAGHTVGQCGTIPTRQRVSGCVSFSRVVQIGRVAYVAFGPDEGKLVTIVDVIDQNRALVDGPCSGVSRKSINFKQLHLTKLVIPLGHSARTSTVKKAWLKAEISEKWAASTWAKKIALRNLRANLCDYDRFKLMKAKQARNRLITIQCGKMRNALKKGPQKPKRSNKKMK